MSKRVKISAMMGIAAAFCVVGGMTAISANADNEAVKTSAFTVETGASIRYSDPTGIRFKVKLGQTQYEELVDASAGTPVYKSGKTLYATIAPMSVIEGMTYSADGLAALNGKGEVKVDVSTIRQGDADEKEDTNYYYANVVLGNVLYGNLGRDFAAIAYTKDGETVSLMETKPVEGRSVAYVASAALADTSLSLDSTKQALLNEYVQLALAYEDGTVEETAKENYKNGDSLSVNPTLSVATKTMKIGDAFALTATLDTEVKLFGKWTSSDADVATVDASGNVTALSAGETTITYSVYGATTTCVITVKDIKPGLTEDFSNGYIDGNTYYGAWEITAAAQHNISLTNDGRLYLTTTSSGVDFEGIWSPVTISGLTPGKVYRFSYDAQVDSAATVGGGNYHMCGWRVFVDSNGYFVQDGNQAVFAANNSMYSNNGQNPVIADETRFNVNHFYGLFVAGSETVTFMLSTNPHTTATYYDNFKMEEVNPTNELATIEGETENVSNATYVAKLGERNVPNQKHLTWEIDNTEIASIAVGATQNEVTLTALSGGKVTITLKFMGIVIATKEIQVQEPAIVSEIAISGPSEIGTGKTGTYTQASAILVKPYTVTWSVDDETKATIDPQTGVLTGVSEGSVVVKAQVDGSTVYATKEVEITPVNLLKIDFEDMEAMKNYTCQPVNEQIGVGIADGRELYYQGQPTGFVTSHDPYLGDGGVYAIFIEDQGGERGNVLHTISNGASGLLQLYIKYTPEMIEAIKAGGSLTFKVKCTATTTVYTDTSFTGSAAAIQTAVTAGEWTTVTISNETLVANGAATQGWFRVAIEPQGLQRLYLDDIEIVPASAQ